MPNPNIESFIEKVKAQADADADIFAIAAAGSATTGETDEYSDLDLVIVTASPIAPDRAKRLGQLHSRRILLPNSQHWII